MEILKVPGVAKKFNIDIHALKKNPQEMEEFQTSENKHGNSQEILCWIFIKSKCFHVCFPSQRWPENIGLILEEHNIAKIPLDGGHV